jgi:hypothetical protein
LTAFLAKLRAAPIGLVAVKTDGIERGAALIAEQSVSGILSVTMRTNHRSARYVGMRVRRIN